MINKINNEGETYKIFIFNLTALMINKINNDGGIYKNFCF